MNALMRRMGWIAILAASVHFLGCGGGSSSGSGQNAMISGGSWYATGFQWPHDGSPWESEHFVIYSDGASEEARMALAQLAEEALLDIKTLLAIDNDDILLFPPGQTKIDIYAYKNRYPSAWGGWAYYGGLLIFSPDHPERTSFGHTEPEIYIPTLRHEVTHVVESLLKASNNPEWVDVWFTEGLAEVLSGGTAGGRIADRQTFLDLWNRYGSLNPIAMHRYGYPDIENVAYEYYYPMFQLAVEYLVDEHGLGKTMGDVRDLLVDIHTGVLFPDAFRDRFGMSLSEYESQFFDRMNVYLPERWAAGVGTGRVDPDTGNGNIVVTGFDG